MARTGRLYATLIHNALCGLAIAGCASDDAGGGDPTGSGASVNTPGSASATQTELQPTGSAGPSAGAMGLQTAGPATEGPIGNMATGDITAGSMTTGAGMMNGGVGPAAADGEGATGPAAADGEGATGPTAADADGAADQSAAGGAGGADFEEPDAAGDSSGGAPEMGGTEGDNFDGRELFLLIGQSNMSGMSPMPSEPWPINERVTFMVQFDCPSLGQTAGEWLPAEPPLHGCQWATNGIGLGLADFFGAKMAEEWADSNIGLIPNAVPGQLISIYLKEGGTQAPVPPEYANAYEMTVDRSLKAQEQGRIRAILLHQGESDDNQMMSEQWLGRVATVIADLRADLNLGEEVPLLAGQIGPSQWEKHNAYVDQIPDYVPNSAVITSEGTAIHDIAHFDEASAKIMGERYAQKFLEMVPQP